MLWKSEAEIRKIVREEVSRALAAEVDYRFKRIYNEKNELVGTEYTHREEEGHIVHITTRNSDDEIKFFVAHSRSHTNFEMIRQSGADAETIDKKYNLENYLNKEQKIPTGFRFASNGLIMPN